MDFFRRINIDNRILKNMQKYKKAAINIAFLTMILSGIMNSSLLASDSDSDFNNNKTPKYLRARQEKIINTFENSDYQAWKKIVGQNNKISNIIEEIDFQRFIAARAAARNGQYHKAIKITENLKEEVKNKLS